MGIDERGSLDAGMYRFRSTTTIMSRQEEEALKPHFDLQNAQGVACLLNSVDMRACKREPPIAQSGLIRHFPSILWRPDQPYQQLQAVPQSGRGHPRVSRMIPFGHGLRFLHLMPGNRTTGASGSGSS